MKTFILCTVLGLAIAMPWPVEGQAPRGSSDREAARRELVQLRLDFSAETLVKQAAEGDIVAVKLLLAAGINPDSQAIYDFGVGVSTNNGVRTPNSYKDTATALISAAANGQAETVQALLAAKADVNRKALSGGHTALIRAAERGHVDTVKLLVAAAGVDVNLESNGMTALAQAACYGKPEIVRLLLDRGASPNPSAAGTGAAALHCALRDDNEALIALLLDRGADVNVRDRANGFRTPLMAAIETGHVDVARRLLEKNPDVDILDRRDRTALTIALESLLAARSSRDTDRDRERTEIVNLLISRGADANKGYCSDSSTPLIFAVAKQWADIAKTLLDKGANVNATAKGSPRTALVAAGKNTAMVQMLTDAGAKAGQ